jgi:class 3 adenylate cyclase
VSDTRACPACAASAPATAKFCPECGTRLGEGVSASEVRKVVTLLFCDLVGSTALGERLDPEAFRRVQLGYYAACEKALLRHGGTIEKFIGDAVFCVFGIPTAHEDDALRACRAAADLVVEIEDLNTQLEADWGVRLAVRIGVNTGSVVVGERKQGNLGVTGDAVNTAARLEQAAGSDEVLIGATTRELVGNRAVCVPVPPLELKGKGQPVPAWRLVDMDAVGLARGARASSPPFVGRERELAFVEEWLANSREGLCLVVGAAGIGKSRFVVEVVARTGRGTYWGRCPPYGEEITYRLLADWLDAIGEERVERAIAPEDVERLRFATERGTTPATMGEIEQAADSLLRELGGATDLVLVAEDVHWAEPSMLDLLVSLSRVDGVAILATARPELLEARPYVAQRSPDQRVVLAPLSPEDADELARETAKEVPDAVRARLVVEAEGNPLMIFQLARHLAEGGEPDTLPPHLEAVLQARVDRLSPEERAVAERGAVMGREFWDAGLAALAPDAPPPAAALSLLMRRDFVAQGRADGAPTILSPSLSGVFSGRGAATPYSFTHALLRDAVYESTPKLRRADLHERLGRMLEESGAAHELIALHFERAARLRSELRPQEHDDLAARAAEHLERAGDRALARRDGEVARALLTRAAVLVDDDAAARDRIQASIAATDFVLPAAELVPGDVVSGYQIRAIAGRGGMGVVYRAEDLALGREIALKVIAPALARDPRFRQRFARESRIAAGLEHPNVLPVYRAGEENGQLFIAMRFVEGTDLQQLLLDGPLPPPRAAAIVAQVGEALDAAHARGLIHRDVKPANVLVAGSGVGEQAYLTDFGLTREVAEGDGLTKTGQWVGTLAYVAPEQIRGEPVDGRADIYALGAVLYQCLTGEPPFPVGSELEALAAHLDEPPPRPSKSGVPRALDAVVERAMSKDPTRRFRSAGDLGRAAVAAVEGGRVRLTERSIATGAAAPIEAGRRRRHRSRRSIVFVGLAAGLVLAAIAVAAAFAAGLVSPGGERTPAGSFSVGPAVRLSQTPDEIALLGERVWALQDNLGRMARLDPASGEVANFTAPIDLGGGSFPDFASGFGDLWVAHASNLGGVDRVEPEAAEGVAHVALPYARAVAAGARWVWATAAGGSSDGTMIRIDPHSNRKVGSPFDIGGTPVALAEHAGSLWIADSSRDQVVRANAASGRITARVDVGDGPGQLVVFPDVIWVANFGDRTLSRIDPKTNRVVGAAISLGKEIDAIAGTREDLWVASADDTLTRLDPASGAPVGTPLALENRHPFSLGSDGDVLWIGSIGDRTLQPVHFRD